MQVPMRVRAGSRQLQTARPRRKSSACDATRKEVATFWKDPRCTIMSLDILIIFNIIMLIPARIRGVSRDVPEAEQGAVPGTRVVTGFLGSLRRQCQRPKHRGGAQDGAINL